MVDQEPTKTDKVQSAIFDWKRTLYNPDERRLMDNAEMLLKTLYQQGERPLHVIGMGDDGMYAEVERLGVGQYLENVIFLSEAKSDEVFAPYVDQEQPSSTLVIGDRTRSELEVGNRLGATTIWVRQGKFSDEIPVTPEQQPTHEVESLAGVIELLKEKYGIVFDAQDLLTK